MLHGRHVKQTLLHKALITAHSNAHVSRRIFLILSYVLSRSVSIIKCLLGLGKTNSVVANVVDRVVFPEECVTENDKRSSRLRDVEAHEGADAATLDLKDVVIRTNGEVVAGKGEGEIGEGVTLLALDGVLAVITLLGTDLLVEQFSKSGGKGDERGAGVKDSTGVVQRSRLVTEGDLIEVDLPVSLAAKRDLGHLAGIVVLVDTTEHGLALSALVVGVAEVETEHGLIEETLLEHAVEWRNNAVHGDGVVAQTHDTVETAKGKGKTGLRSRLGEQLVLDLEVANLDSVLADVALKASGAVSDGKVGAVLLVGGRLAVVVLGVQVAGNGAAVAAGNPQVGATGVQYDLKLLRRGADGDLREILSVEEIADSDGVALLGLDRGLLEHLVGVALGTNAHVLLAESLHVFTNVGVLLSLCQLLRHIVTIAVIDGSCESAYQLLGQRDLLQRHLVDASGGGASRDSGGEECSSLHDCNNMCLMVVR
jgi:hypothetical protein